MNKKFDSSEKQKIAFLCHPWHRGGVTRWMADAAMALTKRGIEVCFITVELHGKIAPTNSRETMLQLLTKENNTVHIIKEKVGYEFEFGTASYRAYIYRKLIVQLPPGTPIILSDDPPVWAAATALHNTYPVIGVLHADDTHYYRLAEKYFRQTDMFVCVSNRISKNLKDRLPEFDPALIYTIPCGINLPAIDNSIQPHPLLQLVYLGRISDYQKRTGDLVKICTLLFKNKAPFHLNIIGDGDAKPALENTFIVAGLQHSVTFCGWLTQEGVTGYLAAADMLLLTSDFEGMPIAMMESLAAGCGVVGTRVSGIEDYEQDPLAAGCMGIYTVGDIEEAVSKINKVAAIPVNERRLAARKLAETQFSMQVCLDKYLDAIAAISPRSAQVPRIKFTFSSLIYSRAIAVARRLKVKLFLQKK